MQNKFAGDCRCGARVEAGAGAVSKVRGKWIVKCSDCSDEKAPAVPQREMLGTIWFPNGLGSRACTVEYEEAHQAALDARQALDDIEHDDGHPDFARLYNASASAQYRLDQLQGDGGHLGAVTHHEFDPRVALLGGGKVTADQLRTAFAA